MGVGRAVAPRASEVGLEIRGARLAWRGESWRGGGADEVLEASVCKGEPRFGRGCRRSSGRCGPACFPPTPCVPYGRSYMNSTTSLTWENAKQHARPITAVAPHRESHGLRAARSAHRARPGPRKQGCPDMCQDRWTRFVTTLALGFGCGTVEGVTHNEADRCPFCRGEDDRVQSVPPDRRSATTARRVHRATEGPQGPP